MKRISLTKEEAIQIGGAIHRLEQISATKITTPQDEAERVGYQEFLGRILTEHANEFLACWIAVHDEYEPLIQGLAGLLQRSTGLIQLRAVQSQPQEKPEQQPAAETAPSNIIKLQ